MYTIIISLDQNSNDQYLVHTFTIQIGQVIQIFDLDHQLNNSQINGMMDWVAELSNCQIKVNYKY